MTVLDEIIDKYDNASEAWRSYAARKELADAEYEWISKARVWKSFITLTFQDEIPEDIAKKRFYMLIRILNTDLIGKHYTRYVKHCYFSYVLGTELQIRGVIHFHLLVDRPVNFKIIHDHWSRSGFAWIDKVVDIEKTIRYVTKYVVKGGQVDHYFSKQDFIPKRKPFWWNEIN